jgi:hypothetical protein
MGEHALPRLLDQIAGAEDEMTSLARRLFAAWLERVVGAPPPDIQASERLSNASVSRR